jgi:hypothetical protein
VGDGGSADGAVPAAVDFARGDGCGRRGSWLECGKEGPHVRHTLRLEVHGLPPSRVRWPGTMAAAIFRWFWGCGGSYWRGRRVQWDLCERKCKALGG